MDSISLMKRAGGSPSPLRCSAARAARSASRGARCLPRPSIPRRTRPTVQAATTKITNIATTKAVTSTPFRQSLSTRRRQAEWGRNCLTGRTTRLRCRRCRWNSSRAHSLPSQDHGVRMERPILAFDFITNLDGQATDSVSRSREEITVETPSPRMLIPYSASAISIVRFWCVMTSNWLVARNSS